MFKMAPKQLIGPESPKIQAKQPFADSRLHMHSVMPCVPGKTTLRPSQGMFLFPLLRSTADGKSHFTTWTWPMNCGLWSTRKINESGLSAFLQVHVPHLHRGSKWEPGCELLETAPQSLQNTLAPRVPTEGCLSPVCKLSFEIKPVFHLHSFLVDFC